MKKYPRIHSLSTLGIIHHHENDYPFHALRTDFMGDSASGKSIIADLLQLIFVGSGAFKSPTATVSEKRDPDGLVLTTPGKGSNIAYAFLNIETADEKYIAIGTYIESNSKYTRPFIIQTSTQIENGEFVPMHIPLRACDLKNGDDICEPLELDDLMDEKQLVFKMYNRTSAYHQILYKNNILPFNLAHSTKTLNDYAKIIQSFSRGKTLDTKKSQSLLDFLFGNEKADELLAKYVAVVKELEENTILHGQNLQTIEQITLKYHRISQLKSVLDIRDQQEKDYLTLQLQHNYHLQNELNQAIPVNTQRVHTAIHSLKQLVEAGQIDIDEAGKNRKSIEQERENAFARFQEADLRNKTLGDAEKLIQQLHIPAEELKSYYTQYYQNKNKYTAYNELQQKLVAKNIETFFRQSPWTKGMQAGSEYYGERAHQIQTELRQLQLLSQYTDPGNPNSLVRWALSLGRPLTPEEESMVRHYQTLPRTEPAKPAGGERYLYSPEQLFENPITVKKDNGFWIHLNGIREFIEYVSEQQLNTVDPDQIQQYFTSQRESIQQQEEKLAAELADLRNISKILSELPNPSFSIQMYNEKEQVKDFKLIPALNTTTENIDNYIQCLTQKDKISKEYTEAQQAYTSANTLLTNCDTLLKKLPPYIIEANTWIEQFRQTNDTLTDIRNQYSVTDDNIPYDLSFYYYSEDKPDTFRIESENLKQELSYAKVLHDEIEQLNNLKAEISKQEETYKIHYETLPKQSNTPITAEAVQDAKAAHIESTSKYDAIFDSIVSQFIATEAYKFESGSKDFEALARNLLADIYRNEDFEIKDIGTKVESHLTRINEKNKQLNSKKIRKIETLLNEVSTAVGSQLETIRGINRFFKEGEKKISGDYRVELKKEDTDIPITWLSDFKKRAGSELSLFETSIADKVARSISIEEKIMDAFREITGNRNRDITLKDLLNPNSYIKLSLEMYDTNGKTNKGSTGQTYAAISLLCIAHLSIVNKKKNDPPTGLRFMPIDEAEGLGSNYDMLEEIARKHDYQIITFAINPLGRYNEQYIYILHRDPDADSNINYTPVAIRSRSDINDELSEIIEV